MRRHLEAAGTPEERIYERLRGPGLKEKIDKWPAHFGKGTLELEPGYSELFGLFKEFQDLRSSLVHPKARDHSIYRQLDNLDAAGVAEAVCTTIVLIAGAPKA